MSDSRLHTALWVEAHLRNLDLAAIPYYVVNKGAYASGTVILKLAVPGQGCQLLIQERDLEGKLGWVHAFNVAIIDEKKVDNYIRSAIFRDPDVWAIEIEMREFINPFQDAAS